jgi:hypothetical protein
MRCLEKCCLFQNEPKRVRLEDGHEDSVLSVDSAPPSPSQSEVSTSGMAVRSCIMQEYLK